MYTGIADYGECDTKQNVNLPAIKSNKEKSEENSWFILGNTKLLMDELFSCVIEAQIGKRMDELDEEEFATLVKLAKGKRPQKNQNGKNVYDFTTAGFVLNKLLSDSAIQAYIEEIQAKNAGRKGFSAEEVSRLLRQEEYFRDALRIKRNEQWGHLTIAPTSENLPYWLTTICSYISYLRDVKLQIWKKYDIDRVQNSLRIEYELNRMDKEAHDLLGRCYKEEEEIIQYTFCGRCYKMDKKRVGAFDFLIQDMAYNWYAGIEYIKADIKNELGRVIEMRYGDDEELRKYRIFREDLRMVELDNLDKNININISYMNLLYCLNPNLNGFFWKGYALSEAEFASYVLDVLLRYTTSDKLQDKINTWIYVLGHFSEWKEPIQGKSLKPGIGIDIVRLCKRQMLSGYYRGKKQYKENYLSKLAELSQMDNSENWEKLCNMNGLTLQEAFAQVMDSREMDIDRLDELLRLRDLAYLYQSDESTDMAEIARLDYMANLADYFERMVMEISWNSAGNDYDWYKQNYSNMIYATYALSGAMKGSYTYRDMTGYEFQTKDEFVQQILYNETGRFQTAEQMWKYTYTVMNDPVFNCWMWQT